MGAYGRRAAILAMALGLLVLGGGCSEEGGEGPLDGGAVTRVRSQDLLPPPDLSRRHLPDVETLAQRRAEYTSHMRALSQAAQKGLAEVVRELEGLRQANPEDRTIQFNLAVAYHNLGIKEGDRDALGRASQILRRLVAKDPQDMQALQALAEVCKNSQDIACEREALGGMVRLRPNDKALQARLHDLKPNDSPPLAPSDRPVSLPPGSHLIPR